MPDRIVQPEIRREVQELSLLFEISQLLDRSLDLRESVHPVLKAMADHMGMLRGSLTLLNRDTGEISIEAAYGLSATQRERGRYRVGEGVTGKVVQTGVPAVVQRISQEPLFVDRTGARKGIRKGDISFICVPIKLGNEVIGALSIDRLFAEDVTACRDFVERGDVRLYTVNSIDNQSWANTNIPPAERARRHEDYEQYIVQKWRRLCVDAQRLKSFGRLVVAWAAITARISFFGIRIYLMA